MRTVFLVVFWVLESLLLLRRSQDDAYASLDHAFIRGCALAGRPGHSEEEPGSSELPRMPDKEVSYSSPLLSAGHI